MNAVHLAIDVQTAYLSQLIPFHPQAAFYCSELYPDRYRAFPGGILYVSTELAKFNIPTIWIATKSQTFDLCGFPTYGGSTSLPHDLGLTLAGIKEGDDVIIKTRDDCFYKTSLEHLLEARKVRDVIFSGLFTGACVTSGIISASRSFRCYALTDKMGDAPEYHPTRAGCSFAFGNPYWHKYRILGNSYKLMQWGREENLKLTTTRKLLNHLGKQQPLKTIRTL